jgi:2-hydroxychromene-2-carboxylate isomerase
MDAAIADPASHRATVEESQEALAKSGHWDVPTFVFEGEPFFG